MAPAAEAPEDDLALAYALMAQRAPEAIAAAYVRLARARMPSPEDLAESQPEPAPYVPAHARAPEAPRPGFEDAVWFRLDFGRNKNAEARWLLPMICRRGHVTKREIGAIRIFDRETRFQVVAGAVERFEAASAKNDGDGGRITRLEDGATSPAAAPRDDRPAPRPRPPRDDPKPFERRDEPKPFERPRGEPKPFDRPREGGKPYAKPREDAPLPRKFRDRAPAAAAPAWSPVEGAAAPDGAKKPYKGKQPHPKSKKKRKPNG